MSELSDASRCLRTGTPARGRGTGAPRGGGSRPLRGASLEHGLHARLAREISSTRTGRRLLAERPRLDACSVSLDALRALPADTLGHAYSRHLEANRIAPLEPSWVVREETSDAGYVCARLRETHDVLHVITGYGTDALGELEIQLFNLGNLSWSPVPLLAVGAAWLGGWLGRYGGLHGVAGQLRAAYVRGRRTPPLAGVIWEDHWHEPLSRVRDLVALTPF